jgi:hypothetical protein
VVDVNAERGMARLSLSEPSTVHPGNRGEILGRGGAAEFTVESAGRMEVRVRAEREGGFEEVRVSDTAVIYPAASRVLDSAEKSFQNIDSLLAKPEKAPETALEAAPDLLSDVTGDVLLDYEAWLQQLESEPSAIPGSKEALPKEKKRKKKIPFYPNFRVSQRIRTGVDYDRTVTDSTAEVETGRFLLWDYERRGEWWKDHDYRLENELEKTDDFIYEEFDYRVRRTLWNGDRFWWRNRFIWKDFQHKVGDSFLYDDFEVRRIKRLSENWDWQRGLEVQARREYEADVDHGYTRLRGISEWNYHKDYDTFFDLSYELTKELRNAPEDADQEYLDNLLFMRYSKNLDDWDFYVTGREEYRDYPQPGNQSDRLYSEWYGSARRKFTDEWSAGIQGRLEGGYYRFTEDRDSNYVVVELSPFLDYWGEKTSFSLSPRIAQAHYFGSVPEEIFLQEGFPRDKSEADYREVGFYASFSWFPDEVWRLTLSNDLYHRWFPGGETGAVVDYLEALLLADSTSNLASLYLTYRPCKTLEFSVFVSHSVEIHGEYTENDFSNFNAGLEALYRF